MRPQKALKTAGTAALRTAPSPRAQILAMVPAGNLAAIYNQCPDKWCPVIYYGKRGWIARDARAKPPAFTPVQQPARSTQPLQALAQPVRKPPSLINREGIRQAALQVRTTIPEPTRDIAPALEGARVHYRLAGLDAAASLTMREAPFDSARVVGTVSGGEGGIEDLNMCVRQWCLIEHAGVKGFVYRRFLARVGAVPGQRYRIDGEMGGDALMVFDFPGQEARKVGEIPFYAGGIVPIGDCNAEWCHVRYLGLVGWVNTPRLVPDADPQG